MRYKYLDILVVLCLVQLVNVSSLSAQGVEGMSEDLVLQNAFGNLFKTSFTFALDGKSETVDKDFKVDTSFSANGNADYPKDKNTNYKISVSIDGKSNAYYSWGVVDTVFAGENRIISGNSYFKVDRYDETSSWGESAPDKGEVFIRSYLGRWLQVPKSLEGHNSEVTQRFNVLPFDQYQRLSDATSQIFTVSTNLGDDAIDGKAMYHYKINHNKEKEKENLRIMNPVVGESEAGLNQLLRQVDNTDYQNLELWIGMVDGLPYRILSSITQRDSVSGSSRIDNLEINFANFGTKVDIEPPQGAMSLQDIFNEAINKFRPELEKAQEELQKLKHSPELGPQFIPEIEKLQAEIEELKSSPDIESWLPRIQAKMTELQGKMLEAVSSELKGKLQDLPSSEDIKNFLDKFKY